MVIDVDVALVDPFVLAVVAIDCTGAGIGCADLSILTVVLAISEALLNLVACSGGLVASSSGFSSSRFARLRCMNITTMPVARQRMTIPIAIRIAIDRFLFRFIFRLFSTFCFSRSLLIPALLSASSAAGNLLPLVSALHLASATVPSDESLLDKLD